MEENEKMAITPKGLKYLLVGLLVMVSGYILMSGGGSDDPEVIILGIVIEVVAIMGSFGRNKKK